MPGDRNHSEQAGQQVHSYNASKNINQYHTTEFFHTLIHCWLLYGHLTATKKFASHKETLGSLGNNGKKKKQYFNEQIKNSTTIL